jgi:general secretion pathway protein E/type IV pilus assembly protein PilB
VHCEHQGYKGRLALMELLKFNAEIDELITQRASYRELAKVAFSKGFKPLAEDGVRRVLEGVTSLDEVARVIDMTARLD